MRAEKDLSKCVNLKKKKKKTVLIVQKTKGREDTEHRKRDPHSLASLKCFYLSQKKHDMVFWLILTLRAMLSIH